MKATTLSAAIGEAWRPAAASRGATWRGMEHWAAFNMNSSLQLSRSKPTWSVTCGGIGRGFGWDLDWWMGFGLEGGCSW